MVLSGNALLKEGACAEKYFSHARALFAFSQAGRSLRTLQLWGISQLFD